MKQQDLSKQELELLRTIRNYIVHEGKSPSIRKLMGILGYSSPNSVDYYIQQFITLGLLSRNKKNKLQLTNYTLKDSNRINTVNIPLVGSVACGTPIFAEENILAQYPIDTQLAKPPHKYFLLTTKGDSMNAANPVINDSDLILVKQQSTAKNGDLVIALINDEATVKEFKRSGDKIILIPHSTNKQFKPIIVSENLIIQGVVASVIPKFEKGDEKNA